MKFSAVANVFFATIAFIVPDILAHRRTASTLNLNPKDPTNISDDLITSDQAGFIYSYPPEWNDYFTGVATTFTIPNLQPPNSGDGTWIVSAYVSMGFKDYPETYLETGIQLEVTTSGGKTAPSFQWWYEWYPNDSVFLTNVTASPGDTFSLAIFIYTPGTATIDITNLNNFGGTNLTLPSPWPDDPLQGQGIAWGIIGMGSNGFSYPLVDFGELDFSDSSAWLSDGTADLSGAQSLDIQSPNGGPMLTNTEYVSSTEFTITYL